VWANPTTRAARIAEQKKAEEQKRKDEAARHAVEAKKAAAANVKSEVGKPSPKSMDDTLRETFRRVSAA
jgi:ribosomal protein S25